MSNKISKLIEVRLKKITDLPESKFSLEVIKDLKTRRTITEDVTFADKQFRKVYWENGAIEYVMWRGGSRYPMSISQAELTILWEVAYPKSLRSGKLRVYSI